MINFDLSEIIKDCFWDYNYNIEDIEIIINNGKIEEKLYLLKKIIINHRKFFKAVKIFSKNELKELLIKIPNGCFKYEFQNIRLLSLKNYYLGEENAPKRLRWILQ